MSSSQAINAQSQSGKRYHLQDRILQGFADMPEHTAKEVARAIGLQYEEYCDAPKRTHDLKKLGKLEVVCERECRVTKKMAEAYRVAGGARFVGQGRAVVRPQRVAAAVAADKPEVKPADAQVVKDKINNLMGLLDD